MDIHSIYKKRNTKGRPKQYHKYTSILSRRHPRFRRLISLIGPINQEVPIWSTLNDAVLYAVIGQMLSGAAAGSIIQRLIKKFGSSDAVIQWARKTAQIKGAMCGVSQRKRMALKEWAEYLDSNENVYERWRGLPTNEYRKQVLSIWGFGPWSADMIAIFHHGRMNIWPSSDTGIKRACDIVLGRKDARKVESLVSGCETVAAIYMWEMLNRKLSTHIKVERCII